MHYPVTDIRTDFEINRPVRYRNTAKRNYFHGQTIVVFLKKEKTYIYTFLVQWTSMHSHHKIQAKIIVIITGSPKISQASEIHCRRASEIHCRRASEIHCGPAKLDFGWPDWPASEKVKHDSCFKYFKRRRILMQI